MTDEIFPAFEPDWAVPPGETLAECLQELGMSRAELSSKTGLSQTRIKMIIHAATEISADDAERLEVGTGVPARLWNRLESNYQADLARLHRKGSDSQVT